MARQHKAGPLIPAAYREAAEVEVAAEQTRHTAFRERVERDQRCTDAARAFQGATDALWSAPLEQAQALLAAVHGALLDACTAIAEAGRWELWERIDQERTYVGFRSFNQRVMSRPSFDWARELLAKARTGRLPDAILKETWETAGLRDAIRWLRIFVLSWQLSGDNASLPKLPANIEQQKNAVEKEGKDKAGAERPTIYWLDNRTYRVGDSAPVIVSEQHDGILLAFLGQPVLDQRALVKRSGLGKDRIATALRRLRQVHDKLFSNAIICPGVKGKGYRADVIDARPKAKA